MLSTLCCVVRHILNKFSFFSFVGLLAFSEGGKLAVRALNKLQDIKFVCFCNAILVHEESMNTISRPKMKEHRLVYDSNFGTWVSWNIVEQYPRWNVESLPKTSNILFTAVYSGSDPLTENSLAFLEKSNVSILRIPAADHLFTKAEWLEMLIKNVVIHVEQFERAEIMKEREVKLLTDFGMHCVRIIEGCSRDMILFVHGLGQNKSGPGFLFSQIAEKAKEKTIVFFDFYGMGDSEYDEATFLRLRLSDFLNQLKEIYSYYINKYSPLKVTIVASGMGCHLAHKLVASSTVPTELLLIGSSRSEIYGLLESEDKLLDSIDTHDIFQKYPWAEIEFSKLGNVPNRIRGMRLSLALLKDLYEDDIEPDDLCISLYDAKGQKVTSLPVTDRLLMSALEREKAIQWILEVLE